MTHTIESLQTLHRPSLLIRAARHGLREYDRKKDLRRVLRNTDAPVPGAALDLLAATEAQHEATRKAGDASYSVSRHLEALIALMAEIRMVRATRLS